MLGRAMITLEGWGDDRCAWMPGRLRRAQACAPNWAFMPAAPTQWAKVSARQRRPRQDGREAPDGFISQNNHDDNERMQHPL